MLLPLACLNGIFLKFYKVWWVCGALIEFKSRPKFDEGIYESYFHLNIIVLVICHLMKVAQTLEIPTIKSSSICLILFQTQMYMNFFSIIKKVRSKQYKIIAIWTSCSIGMRVSLWPINTLRVLRPHTKIP